MTPAELKKRYTKTELTVAAVRLDITDPKVLGGNHLELATAVQAALSKKKQKIEDVLSKTPPPPKKAEPTRVRPVATTSSEEFLKEFLEKSIRSLAKSLIEIYAHGAISNQLMLQNKTMDNTLKELAVARITLDLKDMCSERINEMMETDDLPIDVAGKLALEEIQVEIQQRAEMEINKSPTTFRISNLPTAPDKKSVPWWQARRSDLSSDKK